MKQIKDILSKRKYDNVPCPMCNEDQGYFQLVEGINKFFCTCCRFSCNAKHYSDLRKKWHENNIEVREVIF